MEDDAASKTFGPSLSVDLCQNHEMIDIKNMNDSSFAPQVNLADASDNCWATLFQESGEVLMGITAADLGDMKEENASEYDNMFAEVNFKPFLFRMRAKMVRANFV